jgi:hypothetical protein
MMSSVMPSLKYALFRIAAHAHERQHADGHACGAGTGVARTGAVGPRAKGSCRRARAAPLHRALWDRPRIIDVRRMKRAHVDRQRRIIETHGDEDAAVGRLSRLAADPAGLDRIGCPDDQHRGGEIAIWRSNSWPGAISGSHHTDHPFASIAATSGATRALSLRA